MASAFFNTLLKLLLYLLGVLGSVFIYPLQLIIVSLFPSLGNLTAVALNYLIQEVFPALAWLKGLIVNSLYIHPDILSIIIAELIVYFTLAVSIRALLLVYRLYLFLRGKEI